MKKNNNKGFTLVELIVVLVILAILAAILVPALLGYIDRAREKQYVLNAKSYMTAAQAELSSLYGEGLTASTLADRKAVVHETADVKDAANEDKGVKQVIIYVGGDTSKAATKENHASYTIKGMYYKEADTELWFNGTSWVNADPGTTVLGSYSITLGAYKDKDN